MKKIIRLLKKYFIPHEHNEFKPHFLRHESFLLLSLLIVIIEFGFLVQVFLVFDRTNFLASVLPGVLTSLTNEQRIENHLSPLTESEILNRAAQMKAEDMASKGYFAHVSPEGKTPWYWFEQAGYKFVYAGENLAVNFSESEDVSEAWMASPSHRANIVKANYTEIGIGVAKGKFEGRNTVFVAQLFGTPAKVAVAETTPEPIPTSPKPVSAPTPASTPVAVTSTNAATPTPTEILGEETTGSKSIQKTTQKIAEESSKETEVTTLDQVKLSIEKTVTSPRRSMNHIYTMILLLAALAVLLIIFIKSEIRHPAMVLRGVGLMAIIVIFSFINIKILNGRPTITIPINDLGANVIEVSPR